MTAAVPLTDRLRDLALWVLLVAGAGFNLFALRGYVFEDAYITFRYAANLAAGDGFVFQAGERVLGTSAPLLTLLLGLFGALGVDVPLAGKALFVIALSACGFFGWRILARFGAPNFGALFAVLAVSGSGGVFAYLGMETTLHLALIFFAAYLVPLDRPYLLGSVLGLICLNRYDGVVAVGAVLLVLLYRTRRLPLREAYLSGSIFGAWLVFAGLYFGSPLPNTYAAKAADVGFWAYATGSPVAQAKSILMPLYRLDPQRFPWSLWWRELCILLLLPMLVWGALGLRSLFLRRKNETPPPDENGLPLAALGLTALLLWLGYSVIGPPLEHAWYLVPATYAFLVLGFAAWSRTLAPLFARLPLYLPGAAGLGLVLLTLFTLPWAVGREARILNSLVYANDRVEAYKNFARWVRHHGLQDSTLLTHEPGYLTYLSGQKVIDAAGLVTPNIFFHGPRERRSDFSALLTQTQPDMVLMGSPVMHEPQLRGLYQLALFGAPGRNLYLSRDFFLRHFETFFSAWQIGDYPAQYLEGASPALRHPLKVDWSLEHPAPFYSINSLIGQLDGLTLDGAPFSDWVVTSRGRQGVSADWSQGFRIDFDQLEFLFGGSHNYLAAAQLYVDGLLVYEVTGRLQENDPMALVPLEKIVLPVYGWRGRQGVLVFVSAEGHRSYYTAARLRSQVFRRSRLFDDFESGRLDPAIWQGNADFPATPARELGKFGGLQLMQGNFAATTLFREGTQRIESRPFLVDHDYLSFTAFDFGDGRTRIELRVDGNRRHFYPGRDRKKVDLVTWDLRSLRGREAVLILQDDIPAAELGIGFDSIRLHDAGE